MSSTPPFLKGSPAKIDGYGQFNGLVVLAAHGGTGSPGTTCLIVVPKDAIGEGATGIIGRVFEGCSVGTLPPTVSLRVGDTDSRQLEDRFGPNSRMQFVLRPGRVDIYTNSNLH